MATIMATDNSPDEVELPLRYIQVTALRWVLLTKSLYPPVVTGAPDRRGVTHCCFPSGGGRSLVPTQSTSRLPGRGGSELRTHTGESRAIFQIQKYNCKSHFFQSSSELRTHTGESRAIFPTSTLDSHVPFLFRTSHQAGSTTSTLDSHVP